MIDSIQTTNNDEEEEIRILIASILKKNLSMAIHDRNIILSRGVIAINYCYHTVLILERKKYDNDDDEKSDDDDDDITTTTTFIFKTYCLDCKKLLNQSSIVPLTLNFDDEDALMSLLEKNVCNCRADNEYFKWDYNTRDSFTEIRYSINVKKSLYEMCLEDMEKRKDNYKQLCEKQSNDKTLIYQAIKNLAREKEYNPSWINDIALKLFNVVAINPKRGILLTLNVWEPYQISFDYYFLKCGHCLTGKKIIVDDKNLKMDYSMIRENLDTLDCKQCKNYFLILLIVHGIILAYFSSIYEIFAS